MADAKALEAKDKSGIYLPGTRHSRQTESCENKNKAAVGSFVTTRTEKVKIKRVAMLLQILVVVKLHIKMLSVQVKLKFGIQMLTAGHIIVG